MFRRAHRLAKPARCLRHFGGKSKGLAQLKLIEAKLWGKSTVPKYISIPVEATKQVPVVEKYIEQCDKDKMYAVRSSAGCEDGQNKSYAGHFRTILGVSYTGIWRAVQEVVESYGEHEKGSSVIVQEFINSKKAGVIFCQAGCDIIVINSNFGLCETVVSGHACDKYYVSLEDGQVIFKHIAVKTPLTYKSQFGKVEQLPSIGDSSLTETEISELVAYVSSIRNEVKYDVDIEFCYDEINKLRLLQMRPVTAKPITSVALYEGANIQESLSGITSPLTISLFKYVYSKLYRDAMRKAGVSQGELFKHKSMFDNLLESQMGRVYYRAGYWKSMLSTLPIKQDDRFERMITSTMIGYIHRDAVTMKGPSKTIYLMKSAWSYLMLGRNSRKLLREGGNFRDKFSILGNDMTYSELRKMCQELTGNILPKWNIVGINDFFLSYWYNRFSDRYSTKEELMKVIKIESISTQQIHMLWLLAHSLKCVDALWNCVTNYKKDEFNILMNMTRSDTQCPVYDGKTIYELYENYMTKFRSRTPGELKLETLNIHDDFKQFADLLIGYSQMEHPPTNKMDKSEKLSWVDKIYSYFFGWHATNRENLRLLRSQLFDVIRIIFMKMGDALAKQGIIEASRDILYLTYDEVMKFDDNTTEYFKRVVTERKAMYEQYNKCEIAQTFVSINGHIPVSYNNSDVNTDDIPAFVTGSVVNSGDSLTGEIVIVTDPSQVNVNMRGKILVAKNTDPGYTPLLHLASAILVQEGGDLSHASIVAREIGALCVYGIPNLVDYVIKGNIKTVTIKGNTVIFHK